GYTSNFVNVVQTVSVGDGSVGPDASAGWNYGTDALDGDRSLGTAATGTGAPAGDRSAFVRIQNLYSSNILTATISFDAEVWRAHSTAGVTETITNKVSLDGTNWFDTGLDFYSSIPGTTTPTMLNGHDTANKSNITGTVTFPVPVVPGAVIYIQWFNRNESGTDGDMAINNFTFAATSYSQAFAFVNITAPTTGSSLPAVCGASTVSVTADASASFLVTNVSFQLDGGTTLSDTTVPFSVTFPTVSFGAHTIVATAKDSAGATVRATNTFTTTANQAPLVALTNTFSGGVTGRVFTVGTAVTNQFSASDADGITNMQFLINGVSHFSTNTTFTTMIVNDLLAGTNTFTVRAWDN